MKSPVWVLEETVLVFHEQLIEEFGGSGGVRDKGMLESALARPQNLFAYKKADLFALAASYGFGLVKNHAFIDGNKRIGFAVAILFLERNGYHFQASEADATLRTLALAAGEMSEKEYAVWLEQNSEKS